MGLIKDTLIWSLILFWIALGFSIAIPIVGIFKIIRVIILGLIYLPVKRLIFWYFFGYRFRKALE